MPGFSMGFMTVRCRKNFGFWRNLYSEPLRSMDRMKNCVNTVARVVRMLVI